MIDIKYYENGTLKIKSVREDDSSFRYRAIMGDDSITLKFVLAEAIEFPVGTFVEFQGSTYTLTSPENWSRYGNQNIEYTMLLNGVSATLGKYKLRNLQDNRLKFSMCTTPSEFLDLIVSNLNQSGRSSGWTAQCNINVSEQKTIEFNHTYLIDALKSIADTFKTEYEITSSKVIKLGKVEYNKNNPLPLAYGKGNGFKAGTGRTNSNESKPVEILYVQGGKRNIDRSKYGSAELHLPKGQKLEYEGRTYISDDDGLSIRRYGVEPKYGNEDSFDGSEIYPKHIGTVSAVTVVDVDAHFYDFADDSIPNDLDYNDVLIDGETMTVIFQTGMLAGREFEISKYTHNGRIFEIVPQEIDGIQMPDNTWKPAVGDTYIIYGCTLPDTYIANDNTKTGAEWDLFREAARNMYENEDFKFTFSGELQGKWAKENWDNVGGKLIIGGYVRFLDTHFAPQGVDIRITGIKEFLGDPYSPIIEISNSIVSAGAFESALRESSNQDVKIGEVLSNAVSFTKRRFRDAQETISMLEAAFDDKFSKGINPVSIQTMAMLVGDERLQFKVYNTSFTSIIPFPATFSNGVLSIEACGIRHFSLGITDTAITTSRSEDSYKKWELSAQQLTPSDAASAYYLYAKVSRTSSSSASFELSTEVKTIDGTSGYYYLLVGVLSSMSDDGKRSLAPLFGYTEILPNQILTSSIRSANGDTILDLETGILSLNSNSSDSRQGAGINGRLTLSQIAAWFGGPMVDHELNPNATEFAKSLFRFDGTGYLAKGNITWDENGYGQVGGEGENYALKWNDNEVRIGPNIKLGAGDETIAMLANLLNMFELDTTSVAGKTLIHAKYDGLYSDGDIAAGGAWAGTPSGGGKTYLNELLDVQLATSSLSEGDMLMWNGAKYVNIPQSSITPDLSAYATKQWVLDKKYLTSVPVASVVGQTGNITTAQVATALTDAGYKLTDTTYGLATTTSNGLMSAADKTKLDGIAENANNYTLPTASSSTKGGIKVGTTLSISGEVLDLKSGFPKGTYTKVQIDDYGRVESGSTLSASDIPSLPWSKITTGKPTTISSYGITDAYTKTETDNKVAALQSLLDSMFERVYDSNNKLIRIHSNVTISSSGDLVAGGSAEGGGTSGGAYTQLEWNAIKALTQSESGLLASAYAVKEAYNELNTAIETLAGKATNVKFIQTLTSGKQIGSISIDGKSTSLFAPANYAWSEVTGKPTFATVATSGSYSDLTNKPTIASLMGSAAIGGTSSYLYWNGSAFASKALGDNAFTSISKVSQLTNDSGYITGITKSMVEGVLTGNITSHTHSYIPLADKGLSNGKVPYYVNFPSYQQLVALGYNEESTATNTEYYFKGLCKWAIDNFARQGNILLIGNATPNSIGYCCIQLYSYEGKDANTGLPRYCSGTYISLDRATTNFSCKDYVWNWGGSFSGKASSSSKWASARTITLTGSVTGSVSIDGSANVTLETTTNHTHNYLPLSGGTITGYLTLKHSSSDTTSPLIIDTKSTVEVGQYFRMSGTNKGWIGYNPKYGMYLYTYNGPHKLGLKDDGIGYIDTNTILHSGNYNSYAPKLDGTGASGTWNINISGNAGVLQKFLEITDLNIPSWGIANGYSINYNSCRATVSNAPSTINNANLIMNIQNGNHGTSGQFGWQVGFFNSLNSPYVRKWTAGSVDAWYKLLHSGNYNEFAPSLTGTGATGTWGISISGNAATATDADTLDGVHYQNILERIGSGHSGSGTATGWFRIAETLAGNALGMTFLLAIERSFYSINNESYLFSISINYNGGISITQLSGYANSRLITKIRVDWTNSQIAYIDLYIDTSSTNNNYYWYTVGCAKSYTAWTANPTLAGTAYEFTTVNGCKSDLGFTGNIAGNASSATKLQNSRTIWGQSFDGTGNVSGFPSFPACININRNTQTGAILDSSKIGFEIETYANDVRLKTYSASGGSNPTQLVLTSGGNVGIGTTSPSYKLHIVGTAYATENIIATGDLTAGSDIRYKDKIQDLRLSVHDIALAPAFTYKWNNRNDALVHIGSSAQYWLNTDAKDAVYYDKQNDFYHLNYASLALCNTIILARGMETQEEKIARLEERINELENKLRQYDSCR